MHVFFLFLSRHNYILFKIWALGLFLSYCYNCANFHLKYLVVNIKECTVATFKLGSITSRCSGNEPALHSFGFKLFEIRASSNNSRGDYFFFSHQTGAITRGRRLFQILPKYCSNIDFHQRGTINRGTAIIRGNTVLENICVGSVSSAAVDYMRSNMFHTSLQ